MAHHQSKELSASSRCSQTEFVDRAYYVFPSFPLVSGVVVRVWGVVDECKDDELLLEIDVFLPALNFVGKEVCSLLHQFRLP